MSYGQQAASAYAATSQIVTPIGAVVMVYDGAIQAVSRARQAIEDGRIEDRYHQTQKACKIILGLQAALNFDQGGEVAPMLDRFYSTVFRQLQAINAKNSTAVCDDVLVALKRVRASWGILAAGAGPEAGHEPASPAAAPEPLKVCV